MKSSKPPVLATWVVEHMVPGGRNDALAGDLLEQFSQGRSARWYWRQVFGAMIVGFSKEWLILAAAIGATFVWRIALNELYGRLWSEAEIQCLSFVSVHHTWVVASQATWVGSMTAFNALPVAVALGLYLGLNKTLRVRRFLRGLGAGLIVMALGFESWPPSNWVRPALVANFIATVPLFFALIIAMWAARPIHDGRSTAKILA
jgi:hypothetical protein